MRPYTYYQSAKRIELSQLVPLPGPMTIFLEPTNICNFKCVFCPESFSDYKEQAGGLFQLSLPDYQMVAREIKELGTVKVINFYMLGEPFVNKRLPEFITIAKRDSVSERVIVTSNGSLIRSDVHEAIVHSGLDYLRISIYGGTRDTQKANAQSAIPLETIRQNILGLRRMRDSKRSERPFIYVKMIDTQNTADNEAFINNFRDIADEVVLEPLHSWNNPEEGNLAGMSSEALLATDYFAQKKEVCPFLFYTLVIHSDLQVSVCCTDWNKKLVIGSLREQSLRDIWNGDRLRTLQLMHLERRRHEIEGCKNCTFLHTGRDNLDPLTPTDFKARIRSHLEIAPVDTHRRDFPTVLVAIRTD